MGKKGGDTTAQRYGKAAAVEPGKKGGEALKAQRGSAYYSDIGRIRHQKEAERKKQNPEAPQPKRSRRTKPQ